jgi:hypothetical protein
MTKRSEKPMIVVGPSPLAKRYYATKQYKIDDNGFVIVTGKKHDVTECVEFIIENALGEAFKHEKDYNND